MTRRPYRRDPLPLGYYRIVSGIPRRPRRLEMEVEPQDARAAAYARIIFYSLLGVAMAGLGWVLGGGR